MFKKLLQCLLGTPMSETFPQSYILQLQKVRGADVLELGTKRSNPKVSTVHRDWAGADAKFVMSDFQSGLDVDVVADIHSLSAAFPDKKFDGVIACSVFEHVQRPWIAAAEIAKVLKPGGRIFVQTHFAFPIHGFPQDFWRFTSEALQTIFEDAGLRTIRSGYEFPCQIVSEREPSTAKGEAYLNTVIISEKPAAG